MQRSNPALMKSLLFTCRSVLEDRQCYSEKLLTWSLWPRSKSAEYRQNECSSQGIAAPLAPCTPSAASLFVGCGLVGWIFLLLPKQPKQSRYTCSHFPKAYQRQSIPFSRSCPVSSEAPAACSGCSALFLRVSVLSQQIHAASLTSQWFCRKIQMESDTYFSVCCAHKSKRCSTQPPACSEKSYQIHLCIEQQEKFREAEPLPCRAIGLSCVHCHRGEARKLKWKKVCRY